MEQAQSRVDKSTMEPSSKMKKIEAEAFKEMAQLQRDVEVRATLDDLAFPMTQASGGPVERQYKGAHILREVKESGYTPHQKASL